MIIKCWTVWKAVAVKPTAKVFTGIRRVRRIKRVAQATQMIPTIVCAVVGLSGLPGDAAQIGGHGGRDMASGWGSPDDSPEIPGSQPGGGFPGLARNADLSHHQDKSMTDNQGYHDTGMAIISGHQPHDAGTTGHPTLDTQPHVTAVPEPSSFIILGAALTFAMLLRLRRSPAARCSRAPGA